MNTTVVNTVVVSVTPEHIGRGKPGRCEACPVALALKDHLAPGVYLAVDGGEIEFWHSGMGRLHRIESPACVRTFVREFDWNGADEVEPFTFSLDVPVIFLPGGIEQMQELDVAAEAMVNSINCVGVGD